MRWGMVIDLAKCMRCHGCIAACRVEHALPLHVTWAKLIAYEVDDGEQTEVTTFPVRCNHCADPPCVPVCPTGATYKRDDGIVMIDAEKCIGCRYCAIACPYNNRTYLSPDKDPGYFPGFPKTRFEEKGEEHSPHTVGTTTKCNFCVDTRIDPGLEQGLTPGVDRAATPACVNTCQANALTFGDLDDPDSEPSKLIREKNGFQLLEEYGTDPSVYYVDYKLGGALSNKAPEHRQTGSHMKGRSSVDRDATERLGSAEAGVEPEVVA